MAASPGQSRRSSRLAALTAAGVTAFALVLAPPAAAAPDDTPPIPEPVPVSDGTGGAAESGALPIPETSGKYIVTLAKPPVAAYTGGEDDIPATKPEAGETLQADSAAAQEYTSVITADQQAVAQSVGVTADASYSVALNGFTADLNSTQAQELAAKPEVLSVTKDRLVTADDDRNSADFLKLTGPDGLWARQFGGPAGAGKGIVIGVIDSGIWPESASVAGAPLADAPDPDDPTRAYRDGDRIVMAKADGGTFTGECEAGEQFTADLCSTKIVGARYFADTYLAATPPANVNDLISPRDVDGHGTHTGSTAAGNADIPASVDGRDYGTISGVAPAASISVYKALWHRTTSDTASGWTSDLVAAFDQAVADGVDVINYSVGSSSESRPDDPVELAMLSAASAGIFVAASAGNSGPGASTLDHPSPWVTTVGASTVAPREGTVQLGNGQSYVGASTTVQAPVGPLPLVAAQTAVLPPASAADAALCAPNTLDPAVVAGRIVVCDRGVVDRVAKSAEVKRAGGAGVVLVNLTDNSVNADPHSLPTVHVNAPGGPAIKAYALTAGATATLVPDNTTGVATPYPQIAGFSSRGPSTTSRGDLIKPDIAAPGVDILAAYSPLAGNENRSFNFVSGTSMAAPHIAGLAALVETAHPTWSPMAVKSALMTTAYNLKKADGTANTDPFAQGAGQVDATRMLNPALVYDSSDEDWLAYLEGLGVATGTGVAAVDPSDYNSPSMAVGDLVSSRTITRHVTAVTPGLYRATASVPGFRVTVSPSILNFDAAGQTKQFRVTFTRNTAAFGSFATGFLTWNGGNTTVRSPIALRPLQLSSSAAEATLTRDGTSGTAQWQVTSGFSGPFPITASGMVPADLKSGQVSASGATGVPTFQKWQLTVPAGTPLLRFATRVADDTAGADIDMMVARQTSTGTVVVGQSGGPTADEQVDLVKPVAGTYIVQVSAFADAPGTTSTPFDLQTFLVPSGPVGSSPLTVSPANQTVRTGQTFTVTASATGLEPDLPYLGWVGYPDGSGTVVQVG